MSYVLVKNETSVPIWIRAEKSNRSDGEKNYTIQPGDCEIFDYFYAIEIFSNVGCCVYCWADESYTKIFGNFIVKEGESKKNFDTRYLIISENK